MAKALAALIVALCIAFPAHAAQGKADAKKAVRPAWTELTPAQQKVLAPLEPEWSSLDATRRKKWVTVADRYPKMKPEEQQRLQKRMADWVKLTPEQRQAARKKFQTVQKLPPEKRREVAAQWQRYQRSLAQQPHFSPSDPPAPPDPQGTESATATADGAPAVRKPAAGPATAETSTTTAQ